MSSAMTARLALACAAAIASGIWLLRCVPAPELDKADASDPADGIPARTGDWGRRMRALVLGWCALWAVTWLGIAVMRLRYPAELEWCGGAMRDHCERLLAGLPLYAAPGPDWIPYEYPPLYFWASALLMRLLHDGSFVSLRLVSIVSTLGCAAVLYLWVQRAAPTAAGKTWGAIAAGVFFAGYRFTGAWYDIERLDMLFLLLALLGGYWLDLAAGPADAGSVPDRTDQGDWTDPTSSVSAAGARRPAAEAQRRTAVFLLLSAVAYWLAFLTKQQAVLFLIGSAGAAIYARQWRKLALFSAVSAVLCFGSVALLNRATGGWFGYYCFRVPLANGIKLNLAAQYFLTDLPLYSPMIALIVVLLIQNPKSKYPLRSVTQNRVAAISAPAVAWCLMGLLGSLLSRAHWGGDQNVLMAGFLGITLAACMLAAQLEMRSVAASVPMLALVFAQMLVLVYRPDAQLPTAGNRAAALAYTAAVRSLERTGEVLCLDHGGVTTPRHFHLMALLDVVGTEKGLPPSLAQALKSHRFKAIVTDAEPAPGGALDPLAYGYTPAECLKIDTPWVATGFPTPGQGRQVWVLRPE